MKRHSTYSLLFVSIFLLLASVSCRKEDFNVTAISFMASSRELATKVGYSDEKYNVGGSNYERVNWKVGDLIRIYSADVYPSAGYADYSVRDKDEKGKGGVEARNEKSIAHVNPVNGNGLLWNGNKPHTFYCVYPAPAKGKVTTAIDVNSIKGSIPAEQTYKENLEEDLLMQVGCTKVESPVPSVDVDFTPVTTCFDFTISNGTDTDMQVTSVTLKNPNNSAEEAFSGGFEATFEGEAVKCSATEKGNYVTLTFPEGKQTTLRKSTEDKLRFRIFLNPGNDITSPKFIVKTADGNVRSTTLKKKDDVTFKAMHKTNITGIVVKEGIMVTSFGEPQLLSWDDEHEELGIEAEYRYVYDASNLTLSISDVPYGGETRQLGSVVSYRVKYDTKGVEGVEPAFVGDVPDWLACSVTLDNTKTLPTYNVAVTVKQNIGTHTDVLKNATSKGTSTEPFDLSYYNPSTGQGDGKSGSRNTANCYVVNAPGYYKFPLVYGNTIKNGATNTSAYNNSAFKNAYNQSINRSGGNIKIDADITSSHTINGYGTIPSSSIVSIDGFEEGTDGYKYIKFRIDKTNIKQDNVLITIKSDSDIVWSWHIWVTDADLSAALPSKEATTKIMPVNLGWISGADDTCSSDRECAFKFGNVGETVELSVNQKGKPSVSYPSGTSLYYQWGRKDPSIQISTSESISNVAETIKNPSVFYFESNGERWVTGIDEGFWASNKTIFDPSPVGFKVITQTDLKKVLPDNSKYETKGQSGTNNYYASFSNSIALPFSGWISGNVTAEGIGTSAYYWTSDTNFVTGMMSHYYAYQFYFPSSNSARYGTDDVYYACPIRPQFE